jgi:CRISPR type I-E-associated protein CasB/Cse2
MTDNEIGNKVFAWWKDLTGMKQDQEGEQKRVDAGRTGERAELRRCKLPLQVLTCKGYHRLRVMFEEYDIDTEALASIAGLCAHIKTNEPVIEFPTQLATPEKEKTTPPLSELRFQKMVTSKTAAEFFTHLRRALDIVNNRGKISSIVSGVLLWYKHRNNPTANVQDTLLFQWSKAYYNVILSKETKSSK